MDSFFASDLTLSQFSSPLQPNMAGPYRTMTPTASSFTPQGRRNGFSDFTAYTLSPPTPSLTESSPSDLSSPLLLFPYFSSIPNTPANVTPRTSPSPAPTLTLSYTPDIPNEALLQDHDRLDLKGPFGGLGPDVPMPQMWPTGTNFFSSFDPTQNITQLYNEKSQTDDPFLSTYRNTLSSNMYPAVDFLESLSLPENKPTVRALFATEQQNVPNPGIALPSLSDQPLRTAYPTIPQVTKLEDVRTLKVPKTPFEPIMGSSGPVSKAKPKPIKTLQCPQCDLAFSRRHDLNRHSRIHTNERPFTCLGCGNTFKRTDARQRHWRGDAYCKFLDELNLPGTAEEKMRSGRYTRKCNRPLNRMVNVGPGMTSLGGTQASSKPEALDFSWLSLSALNEAAPSHLGTGSCLPESVPVRRGSVTRSQTLAGAFSFGMKPSH